MPRKRSNKLDLSKGLWLKTEEGKYIALSKKKITAENITPQPIIRYGKAPVEGSKRPIELVQGAPWPVFRGDTVEKLLALFKVHDFKATSIYKDSDEEEANSKFNTLMTAAMQLLTTIPLDTYKRGYLDRKGNAVASEDVYKYQVVKVNETTGKEVLEEFPYLEMTHMIEEKDDSGYCIWPRIYYDMWLPDSVYQLTAKDDASRFELWRLAQKLNEYPFPVKDDKDEVKLDDEGNPVVKFEEGMIVKQGYIAQSGSTKQYHALIVPERIQVGGEDKFVFLMKLTRTIRRYAAPMAVPAPGEVPITVMREQKPLVMESFAEMLKTAAA